MSTETALNTCFGFNVLLVAHPMVSPRFSSRWQQCGWAHPAIALQWIRVCRRYDKYLTSSTWQRQSQEKHCDRCIVSDVGIVLPASAAVAATAVSSTCEDEEKSPTVASSHVSSRCSVVCRNFDNRINSTTINVTNFSKIIGDKIVLDCRLGYYPACVPAC